MNVIVVKHVSKGVVLSTGYTKKSGYFRRNPPRSGYFKVCWKRKHGHVKDITGLLRSRKKAKQIAEILNSLSPKDVKMLVKILHTQGEMMHVEKVSKKQPHTGRSFEWPR